MPNQHEHPHDEPIQYESFDALVLASIVLSLVSGIVILIVSAVAVTQAIWF